MKKYIIIIIGMLMALTANADVTIDNITYVLDDTNMEAKVKTSLNGTAFTDNKVTIPETITSDEKTYKVTGVEAFSNKGAKMELVLPKSVTYIKAVKSGIVTLNVPAAVTSITDMYESADLQDFKVDASNTTYCDVDGVLFTKDKKTLVYMPFGRNNQSNLGYTVPDGTEHIGEASFYKMNNLATIVLPTGLTSIEKNAFNGCTSLLSFTVSKGLKTIGESAFSGCSGLQTVIYPEGMEEIGPSAFTSCSGLTSIIIGEGLKKIGTSAFEKCSNLVNVQFPSTLETIRDFAFYYTNISNLVLPDGLQTIGKASFVWNITKNIRSLTLPANILSIGEYAFGGQPQNLNWSWNDGDNLRAMLQRLTIDTIYVHMAPYTIPDNALGTRTTTTLVVPKNTRDIYSTAKGWRITPNVIEGDWEAEYDKTPFYKGDDTIEEGMTVTQGGITYKLYAKEGRKAHLYSDLKDYPNDIINLQEEIYFRANNYILAGVEMFKSNRIVDLVLPKTITTIKNIKNGVKTLNVPTGVTSISDMQESADLYDFKVAGDNQSYKDVFGVLFSKDQKTLVYMPFGRNSQVNLDYTVPNGTTTIGENAFYKMTNLAALKFPEGVVEIKSSAFYNCSGLQSITFIKGLKTIGQNSFNGCSSVQALVFPEGLNEIGSSAFYGCTSLVTISFAEGLKTIGSSAFERCSNLVNVQFPSTLETIRDFAFYYTNISNLVLPDGLQTIGKASFVWNITKNIRSLTLPANILSIGEYAFGGQPQNLNWSWNDGDNLRAMLQRLTIDTIYVHMAPYTIPDNALGTRTTTTLVVPKNTRDIYSTAKGWRITPNIIEGDWEAEYDKSLFQRGDDTIEEGMTITQNGITYKLYAKEGRKAHLYSDLTDYSKDSIILPEKIYFRANNYNVAGVDMFKSNRIVDLVLPNAITSIKSIKSGVKTLNIPASVNSISDMHESADLQEFKVDINNKTYCDADGVLYSKDKTYLYYMPYARNKQDQFSYTIPDGTTTIGEYAFYKMTNISRIQTNSELQVIKDYAFQGCTNIGKIGFAKGLKKIGSHNFSGCTSLTQLSFPENMEEIGASAFYGCTSLVSVTIGEGLKTIGTSAFEKCSSLLKVQLPSSLEIINDFAFYYTNITNLTLPEKLQTLGKASFVWNTTKKIQSMTIPANVQTIGEYAFGGQPQNLNWSWNDGDNLRAMVQRLTFDTIYSRIMEPMNITSNSFGTITNTVLVVPSGTKQDYLLYNGWKDFGDRIEESDLLLPSNKICETPKFTRDKDTLTIATETEGATIYYTMDKSDPTEQSLLYDNSSPIVLTENCTVKAIAMKEGLEKSAIAKFDVNWFTVANVEFKWMNTQLELSTKTEGAIIRYTVDGKEPTEKSTAYQGVPLSFNENCTIKAFAMKTNWNSSRVDSFYVNLDDITCATPTFRRSGKSLVIETATVGGEIYYTMDDTEPTIGSLKYDASKPIVPTENCIVRAVVIKEGLRNSAIGVYQVDWFAVSDVVIKLENLKVTMSTETEGATIRYTIDGSAPTEQSAIYKQPLTLPDSTIVKAFAMKKNLTNSPVTTYMVDLKPVTCATPTFRMSGKQLIIETTTAEAQIYYTTDGTEPTINSQMYDSSKPIVPTENCTVKAIAVKEDFINSEIGTFKVDWFAVSDVVIKLENLKVVMSTETEGATIRYTIDGSAPTEQSTIYKQPLTLPDSTIVKAFAMKDNLTNSPVTTFMVDLKPVTCATPTFRMAGKQLIIETTTADAQIYYTTNDTEPTVNSQVYDSSKPIVPTENCTVKAIAVKEGFINSEIGTFTVDWLTVADVVVKLENLKVVMSTETEGATIRYTIDGSAPTEQSTIYKQPLTLPDSTIVKAFAMKDNLTNSPVTTFMVDLKPVTCATPTFRMAGKQLIIETTTADAQIYYTTNDTEPTVNSQMYDTTTPIVPTENCTVRAIAVKEGFINSEIGTFTVDWLTVSDVIIELVNLQVDMHTETEGAVIRYTVDGYDPTEKSTIFRNPLSLADSTIVKAFAMKDNLNNSPVTTFMVDLKAVTCADPTFRVSGKQLVIETSTIGAVIYYTLDETEPTKEQGIKYEGPLTLTKNCIVKAVVTRDGYRNSNVKEYDFSPFTVSDPTFAVNGTMLTITCDTEDATIYYAIGENAKPETQYKSPIALTDNQPVRAIAKRNGYKDSQIAVFEHSLIACSPTTLDKYDGRYFTLNVPEGAKAYYTLDGSTPTSESAVYTGRTAVTGLCTVKTLATKEWMNDSEVMSYDITYFFNGESADVTNEGELEKAFEWNGTTIPTTLNISGPLNAADLAYIKEKLATVQHLSLKDATIAGNALPDEAFAGMQMVTFSSPGSINSVGNRILADCSQLAAVIWNCNERMPANTFGDQLNPNMLVYVTYRGYATATNVRNIVVNGTATEIVLSDAEGNNNFYCPQAFKAQKVNYTHNYSMNTEMNKCMGWETIALPFTVQKIAHATKGEIIPFKKFEEEGSSENARPFWLRQLTDGGFEDVAVIEANTPYIISMPNSKEYASRYNLAGNIIFSAENADIPVSRELSTGSKGSVSLIPNYLRQAASKDIWAINKGQEVEGNAPGSSFVPGLREIRPFEAYATNSTLNAPRIITIEELGGMLTGIYDVLTGGGTADDDKVKVYNLSGTLVKTGNQEDEIEKSLPSGVYIINGKKVMIK